MPSTVQFSKSAANVFLHVLTRCNLRCRHCYINPEQHGRRRLPLARIERWLEILALRSPGANLVLLGGEPTLHPELPQAVRCARRLGYASVTIDTNGYLFHDILARVTPAEVDVFSFSLDGATAAVNDRVRGEGSYATCVDGIRRARARGFHTSLIFTVSRANLDELDRMGALLTELGVERFFIQVLGLRGQAAADAAGRRTRRPCACRGPSGRSGCRPPRGHRGRAGCTWSIRRCSSTPASPSSAPGAWPTTTSSSPTAGSTAARCARTTRSTAWSSAATGWWRPPALNERDFFRLNVAEGCVMNALIQPCRAGTRRLLPLENRTSCRGERMTERTLRQRIDRPAAGAGGRRPELSQALGVTEKEVYAHLGHIQRSAVAAGAEFVVTPSECLACGYVFADRRRLTRPGRCPRCRARMRALIPVPHFP